jgi:hypothetical protein
LARGRRVAVRLFHEGGKIRRIIEMLELGGHRPARERGQRQGIIGGGKAQHGRGSGGHGVRIAPARPLDQMAPTPPIQPAGLGATVTEALSLGAAYRARTCRGRQSRARTRWSGRATGSYRPQSCALVRRVTRMSSLRNWSAPSRGFCR